MWGRLPGGLRGADACRRPRRRYHAAIERLRSWPWLRIARVVFALYLVGALISVWLPGDWRQADVTLYRTDALAFWGHLAHPSLPHEYPPLAVIPFALALIGPPAAGQDSFALGMAALFVLGFVAVRRWKGPSRAWTYGAYTLAAGPATLLFRYDIVPGLLVLVCLWLLERRRFAPAYPLIAVGTLVKLFPLVLLPVTAIAHARADRRGGGWGVARRLAVGGVVCIGIVAAGFALGRVIDPAHGLGAITYDLRRPVEVESVPATLMWLGSLVGAPIHPTYSFGSYNLTGPLSAAASLIGDVGLVVGMLWVWWRQLSGRIDAGSGGRRRPAGAALHQRRAERAVPALGGAGAGRRRGLPLPLAGRLPAHRPGLPAALPGGGAVPAHHPVLGGLPGRDRGPQPAAGGLHGPVPGHRPARSRPGRRRSSRRPPRSPPPADH